MKMMKAKLKLSLISSALLFTGALLFLCPSVTFAQSGDFVFIQQGNLASTTSFVGTQGYSVEIGSGYTGTTTGAYTAVSYNNTTAPSDIARISIEGFTSSNYTTPASQCQYNGQNNPIGVYSATSTNPFLQLTTLESQWNNGCTLDPSLFYLVTVETRSTPSAFAGIETWAPPLGWSVVSAAYPDFFPQFAVVGAGFQITPTASSSGLFLSGANAFCASVFASSTAPGLVTDFGIAGCDVVGYMFVPTPVSIQQFQDFSTALQQKIPFSYAFGAAGIFQTLSPSSTQNMPAYVMPLSYIDFSSSTPMGPLFPASLDFLSSTTINEFLPVGMHDLIYNLMIAMIWVEVLFVLYHKVVPTKAKI